MGQLQRIRERNLANRPQEDRLRKEHGLARVLENQAAAERARELERREREKRQELLRVRTTDLSSPPLRSSRT